MKLQNLPLQNISIRDDFWDRYISLVPDVILPYQWQVLNDERDDGAPSHAVRNFRIAAGREKGTFYGFIFQDSDVAKWLEAAAYSLAWRPDPELEAKADDLIVLLEEAQQSDGYLDTAFLIGGMEHAFSNLRDAHELYCAGHLIEAGTAYYRVTGKRRLLDICCRMADHIVEVFHTAPLDRGFPGHEEIELALIKLYETTGKEAYLQMAVEFLNRRGQEPHYFLEEQERPNFKTIFIERVGEDFLDYFQTHKPVRLQKQAAGHAVRAVYLYCAMADAAYYTHDEQMLDACRTLYRNIVERQMYITGGIGSSGMFERFTTDYDLPNDSNYSESCASIGLALFCRRMAQITHEAHFMDTAETALCNTILAGTAMDGQSFFYVNPLSVWPEACMDHTSREHVKPVRQKWFSCACCPPNIARTLASLGDYLCFADEDGLWINLFVSGRIRHSVRGQEYTLEMQTSYPYDGRISMRIHTGQPLAAVLRIRVPSCAEGFSLLYNGVPADSKENRLVSEYRCEKGYAILSGLFRDGDAIEMNLDLPARIFRANPQVRADAGRAALVKGPLVYCLEQIDNGENLESLVLDSASEIRELYDPDLFGGCLRLQADGWREIPENWDEHTLYAPVKIRREPVVLNFVPYAFWGNREPGEMNVWVRAR